MKSEQLRKQLDSLFKDLTVKRAREEQLLQKKEVIENKIAELNIETLEQASAVLQKLSENQRNLAKVRLEELATQALRYSIGGEYSVIIELEDIRKRPQANVFIYKNENGEEPTEEDLEDPFNDNGGGLVDIISTAIKLVVAQAQDIPIEGPLILDEPFKMLSKEYVPLMSDFIKRISKDFGRQIIVVTHQEFLAESAGTKIRLD